MSDPSDVDSRNDQINAAIAERARTVDVSAALLDGGQSVVVMDDDGRMVRRRPDGTSEPLD